MASMIIYDSKPALKDPLFMECLPGVGNVGKTAGDFIADSLNATKFASIYSKHFPAQVLLDESSIAGLANNELWYAKDVGGRDIIFLVGDYQASTQEGQFEICSEIMEILLGYNISEMITLGGYGTGNMVEEPRVMGAASDMKIRKEFEKCGVTFLPCDPQAGIIGASGLFLGFGKIYGIPSICLMGETSGYFVDHKSAMATVNVLKKALKIDLDLTELKERSEQIDEITAKVKEFEAKNDEDDLGYFG